MKPSIYRPAAILATALLAASSMADESGKSSEAETDFAKLRKKIAGIELADQDGRPARLYDDLMKDRVVGMSFVFTNCPGICPPIGANMGKVQPLLGDKLAKEIGLITITVDPKNDTPEKMRAWGEKFGAKPGWSLLTDAKGQRDTIDALLKALKVYTPDFVDHSPFILLLDDRRGEIERIHGIASKPGQIATKLLAMADGSEGNAGDADNGSGARKDATVPASAGQRYFSDIELVDQHGDSQRFYTDLIKGKVVLIGSFFSTCKGACPVMMSTLERIQDSLGERMGSEVHMISVTVDPLIDTPSALKVFADKFHAKDGWYFLTGDQATVDTILKKLGFFVEARESHSNVLLMGNDRTGLWKKAKGLADPASVAKVFQTVLDDAG